MEIVNRVYSDVGCTRHIYYNPNPYNPTPLTKKGICVIVVCYKIKVRLGGILAGPYLFNGVYQLAPTTSMGIRRRVALVSTRLLLCLIFLGAN